MGGGRVSDFARHVCRRCTQARMRIAATRKVCVRSPRAGKCGNARPGVRSERAQARARARGEVARSRWRAPTHPRFLMRCTPPLRAQAAQASKGCRDHRGCRVARARSVRTPHRCDGGCAFVAARCGARARVTKRGLPWSVSSARVWCAGWAGHGCFWSIMMRPTTRLTHHQARRRRER